MKRPASLTRSRVKVEPYLGQTGQTGAKYGPGTWRNADVQGKRRTVTTSAGTNVIGSAVAVITGADVALLSRLTWDGTTYTVLESIPHVVNGTVVERELILGRAA